MGKESRSTTADTDILTTSHIVWLLVNRSLVCDNMCHAVINNVVILRGAVRNRSSTVAVFPEFTTSQYLAVYAAVLLGQ